MTDIENLYAAIVANPGDDTPRLMYADALDERGLPGDEHKSAFIKAQIELARIGPKYTVVEGDVSWSGKDRGRVVADGENLKVGQRVDFWGMNRLPERRGWVIERIEPLDPKAGLVTLHLHKDEFSGPYPQKRVDELESAVFRINPHQWELFQLPEGMWWDRSNAEPAPLGGAILRPRQPQSSTEWIAIHFNRGFASKVYASYENWARFGDAVSAANPVSLVGMLTDPVTTVMPVGNDISRFALPVPNQMITVAMSDREYQELSPGIGEPDAAEREVTLRLLRARWPWASEWDLSEAEDQLPDVHPYNAGPPYSDTEPDGTE